VDFKRRMITVQAAYAKNGESRSMPMNDVLHATSEEVRINSVGTRHVFLNRNGTPYRSFRTAFERAVRAAEISDCVFRSLRHTSASRLVMADVDLPTVKELMGHKRISMTLRYSYLSSDHKRNTVGRVKKFGTNFHQCSQQAGDSEVGSSYNPLKNNIAPLAQMDRAPDF
jgi:integrase